MVTDAEGQVSDTLHLQNRATKGKTGGRSIPLHPALARRPRRVTGRARGRGGADLPVIFPSGAGVVGGVGATVVSSALSDAGAGRVFVALRTPDLHYPCGTKGVGSRGQSAGCAALAGHASLAMTQRYIEGNDQAEAHRVDLKSISIILSSCPYQIEYSIIIRVLHGTTSGKLDQDALRATCFAVARSTGIRRGFRLYSLRVALKGTLLFPLREPGERLIRGIGQNCLKDSSHTVL